MKFVRPLLSGRSMKYIMLSLISISEPIENVKEILSYIIKQSAFSKSKKIGYLNAFVKLIEVSKGVENLGFPLRSILIW